MSVDPHVAALPRKRAVRPPSPARGAELIPARYANLRVLIVHDWIVAWGGAERTVEQLLAIFPSAHLVVGVLSERNRHLNAVTARAEESWVARMPLARSHHRWF